MTQTPGSERSAPGAGSPDRWESGDPYEQYIGRWSRKIAPLFLSWLSIPAGRKWVDVGCGTGALSAAILEQASPAQVVGVEPSEGFLCVARRNLGGRARLEPGGAAAIPLDDSSADVVVSGLALNFFPDVPAALLEMARVTGPGGVIGAYVWDYAEKMELLRIFWDAAVEHNPQAISLDEGVRFPVCRPAALKALFEGAGLREVASTALDGVATFAGFDDYWRPFLGGQGPAPAYVMSLDDADRTRLRDRIRARIPAGAGSPFSLTARAWGVRGTVAGRDR